MAIIYYKIVEKDNKSTKSNFAVNDFTGHFNSYKKIRYGEFLSIVKDNANIMTKNYNSNKPTEF